MLVAVGTSVGALITVGTMVDACVGARVGALVMVAVAAGSMVTIS
jgi:hypothetical protein